MINGALTTTSSVAPLPAVCHGCSSVHIIEGVFYLYKTPNNSKPHKNALV